MFKATELRFRTGDVAALDKIAAEAKLKELQAQLFQNKKDIVIQQQQLMLLLDRNEWMLPLDQPLEKIVVNASPATETAHPLLVLLQQNVNIASSNISVQKNTNKPEFSGLKQADAIIKAASLGYRTGEINFAELSQFLSQAIGIRQNYLEVLNQYNQSAIQYNYFNNK